VISGTENIISLVTSLKSDFAYWYRCYRSVVCLSVCLSVCHVRALCSNGRRYRKISFAYDSPMFLPDRVTPVNPSIPKHCPKVTTPWLERLRHSMAKCDRIVQWSQWRAYRKPPTLFGMVSSLTPFDPSPKLRSKMHPRTNFATPAATWRVW